MCVHPYATWRTHPKKARAVMVFVYAAASYVLLLGLLLLTSAHTIRW